LLAQVARLEVSEATFREEADRREAALRDEAARREEDLRGELARNESAAIGRVELSKARIVDLERELTVRDSSITDLRSHVSSLEAELRGAHARAEGNALDWAQRADELSHRIADLVDKHQAANERVYELEPVANQVPMLQAAVVERDAELTGVRQDIEAIASRPVTGPVFRLLTKGKLRR
jgi:chromosome segregation ATPase